MVQRGLLTIKSNHHQYFSATVTVLGFFNYWSNLWPPAALITNDTCVKSTWRLRGCLLAAVAYFRTGQLLGRGLTPYTWHISEYLECNLKKSVAKLHRMANFANCWNKKKWFSVKPGNFLVLNIQRSSAHRLDILHGSANSGTGVWVIGVKLYQALQKLLWTQFEFYESACKQLYFHTLLTD